MATITLYKDKLNGAGGLIDNIIKSSNSLDTQLGTLKSTLQGVSNSTYNLQDTVNSISSSSKTEKEKVSDLKKLNKQVTEFITTTVKRDNSARDEINKSKKDFYAKYNYLKPDCEKNAIEKIVDKVEKAAKWCAKHWKSILLYFYNKVINESILAKTYQNKHFVNLHFCQIGRASCRERV